MHQLAGFEGYIVDQELAIPDAAVLCRNSRTDDDLLIDVGGGADHRWDRPPQGRVDLKEKLTTSNQTVLGFGNKIMGKRGRQMTAFH